MRNKTSPADAATFGHWLQMRRKHQDLTQQALAALVGCSPAAIRKIEIDQRRPSQQLAGLLADALKIPKDEREAFVTAARHEPGTTMPRPFDLSAFSQEAQPRLFPMPATSLIGRDRQIALVCKRVLDEGARLLTLVGAPGIGKTRLAIGAGLRLAQHFEDGAVFVSLAHVRDADRLGDAIAETLDLKLAANETVQACLLRALREKHLLMVLDNFEQVGSAAPFVADLLQECTWLTILATSRVPMRLRIEKQFPVPALPLPNLTRIESVDELEDYAAVALFADRARAAKPSFAITDENGPAIAALCVQMDGLPLAIELVATRIQALESRRFIRDTPFGPIKVPTLRLTMDGPVDLPERQQTLRKAIDWSYQLLDPRERKAFDALGIFVGGFSTESANAVAQIAPTTIESLVQQNLVRKESNADGTDDARFSMLEAIREFALEQLVNQHRLDDMRTSHLDWAVALAEQTEPELIGPKSAQRIQELNTERGNWREALDYGMSLDGDWRAVRLANALWRFWFNTGDYAEGVRWYDQLVAKHRQPESQSRQEIHAAMLNRAGIFCYRANRISEAITLVRESLDVRRSQTDLPGMAQALNALGIMVSDVGRLDEAESLYQEAAAVQQQLGNEQGEASVMSNLARLETQRGHYRNAWISNQRAISIFARSGDRSNAAVLHLNLSGIALKMGMYDEAQDHCEQCLAISRQMGDRSRESLAIGSLGSVAYRRGDLDTADRLFHQHYDMVRELGDQHNEIRAAIQLGELAGTRGNYAEAQTWLKQAIDMVQASDDVLNLPYAQNCLGRIMSLQGIPQTARAFHQNSLERYRAVNDQVGQIESREGLAIANAIEGDIVHATTILAECTRDRERLEVPRTAPDQAIVDKVLSTSPTV